LRNIYTKFIDFFRSFVNFVSPFIRDLAKFRKSIKEALNCKNVQCNFDFA